MANEIMIPTTNIPAHIQALMQRQDLLQDNRDAADGIGAGTPPTITANQGMFKKKVDGVEEVIQMNVEGMGLINAPKIAAIILKGKKPLDRAFYATAYAGPSAEAQQPDCSSEDGIKPKADAPHKQCDSCAGCPQNVFGTAKLQDGSPGKGKACSERKRLAIATGSPLGVYRFNVPPASLGDFAAYSRQLEAYGYPLSAVVTTISFDPDTPTKLVFAYQGVVPEGAVDKIQSLRNGPEVQNIMQEFTAAALPAPTGAAVQTDDSAAKAEAAKKAAEEKAEADKKAKDEKAAKAAAAKKAKEEKEAAEKAAAAAASAGGGMDLGLDLGMGGDAAPASDSVVLSEGEPSDAELAALFG